MASAASAPVFERVAGIRAIAESGRFKASSSPLPRNQAITCFNHNRSAPPVALLGFASHCSVVVAVIGIRLATNRGTPIPITRSQIL
ncbi:unnamed protein product [Miscanthus lutarioriparius]|uniref:Uncharacterized protein n=1 Tax=Miscanthus lutarioriparius TaxID=422564 RepID=A0A811R4C0_9POAL|nr:unnamed protein product [Miscanthus lutarioriparius]